ncbi:hypothetical protein [Vannielia sp. SX4]|uniref:hypothetical protein n=1 Tax=Vannielia sp. SX4 TaxID=3463852 RepID=UPI004059B735
MTDTTHPSAVTGQPPADSAEGLPPADHDNTEAAPQVEADAPSDEQGQSEDAQREEKSEEERLAALDLETEDDKADTPLDATVWGTTGHTGADEALRTLQNVGLSTDDAKELLFEAAMARDPSMVDQKALTAKIGPRRAKAIMERLEQFARDMRPRDERVSNDLYQHANGPHAFQRLMEQASETLSTSELQGYVMEMGKGGLAAQRAVERLQAVVSGKAPSLDRHVHTEQYSAPKPMPQPEAGKGITSQAYVAAMDALHGPGSRLSFEAIDRREAELRKARRIGRENGLP